MPMIAKLVYSSRDQEMRKKIDYVETTIDESLGVQCTLCRVYRPGRVTGSRGDPLQTDWQLVRVEAATVHRLFESPAHH